MAVERDRVYKYPNSLTVRYADVETTPGKEEPCIWLQRNIRNKPFAAYVLPLGRVFELRDDESLMGCAMKAAITLDLPMSKDRVHELGSILQNHIDELIQLPPPKPKTLDQFLDNLGREGMNLKMNGEALH